EHAPPDHSGGATAGNTHIAIDIYLYIAVFISPPAARRRLSVRIAARSAELAERCIRAKTRRVLDLRPQGLPEPRPLPAPARGLAVVVAGVGAGGAVGLGPAPLGAGAAGERHRDPLAGANVSAGGNELRQVLGDVDDVAGMAAVEQLVPDEVAARPAAVVR